MPVGSTRQINTAKALTPTHTHTYTHTHTHTHTHTQTDRNGEAHPSILVYCLKLSKLVVKGLTDMDATSPTLNMLDGLSEGHAQAFHHLKKKNAPCHVRKSSFTSLQLEAAMSLFFVFLPFGPAQAQQDTPPPNTHIHYPQRRVRTQQPTRGAHLT